MERREFLRLLGGGLAATWAGGRLFRPRPALASPDPEISLALLADAHLVDGDDRRPEALNLVRAVAEIRALKPAPDLVLFAGDLAHHSDPQALALGQEILSDLPAPLFLVMGEGDGLPDAAPAWRRLFGDPWFSNLIWPTANRKPPTCLQVLGLHAAWCPGPGGPGFYVGESGRRWLARELARLDPGRPLLLLTHAPLARLFRPWQQWTGDAPEVVRLLAQFSQVFACHGHVHFSGASGPGPGAQGGINLSLESANRKAATANRIFHQGLPATAWPRPDALQGTPAALRQGLGPRGCGWAQVFLGPGSLKFQPRLWQA